MKILFVDDEREFLEMAKLYLEREYEDLMVDTVSSGEEALEMIKEGPYDAVVSDYKMPIMDGLELLEKLRMQDIDIPFFVLTARGGERVAQEALNLGANGYFSKFSKLKEGFSKLANVLMKSVQREEKGKKDENLIAWIEKKTVADVDQVKYDLKKLSEKVGFRITKIETQDVSPKNEIVKMYTDSIESVPSDKKDEVKEWKEKVTWSSGVVDADVKIERIRRDSDWMS